MLYVFYGLTELGYVDARDKAKAFTDGLLKKRKGALLFRITADESSRDIVSSYIEGQGLFIQKYIVVLDGILSDTKKAADIVELLPDLKTSPHIFVIIESNIAALLLKKIEAYADSIKLCEGKNESKSGGVVSNAFKNNDFPSLFLLADAIGMRDKKKAWQLYREAIDRGVPTEEIIGTLFWQMKMILLAIQTTSANAAGVKDFPYQKAKRFAAHFTLEEAAALSHELISIYHDAHRGVVDPEIALEKVMLSL